MFHYLDWGAKKLPSNTVVTKEVIAYSLKYLTRNNNLEDISITQIMEETGLRRQTFYDHFDDKYDLLTWILGHELTKEIENHIENRDLSNMIKNTLEYLNTNKIFYTKVFLSDKFNSFNNYFSHYFQQIFEIIVMDKNYGQHKSTSLEEIDKHQFELIVNFNTAGFTDAVKSWLINESQVSPKDFSYKILKVLAFSL